MGHSLDSIKVNLMVGIGGGIPSKKNEIRLGDVVVSKPGPESGGVVQYDFGKTVEAGEFIHTHTLDSTDPTLLSALSTMQIRHFVDGNTFGQYISKIPTRMQSAFASPAIENDHLFEANYDHVGGSPTCDKCDVEKLVTQNPRLSTDPVVHYGTIVSGNQVMRHGSTREQLGQKFDALCFEMEAAGLMNYFRCAVIRGICDYADSHKNKQWQPYAALSAAAYTKKLHEVISPEHISTLASITPVPTALSPSVTPDAVGTPLNEEKSVIGQYSYLTGVSPTSFFVFNPVLLPQNSVALGRLVINTRAPWEDFCPHVMTVEDQDILIVSQPRIREMVESARGTELYERLSERFSFLLSEGASVFRSTLERTHFLLNSGNWFESICADAGVRPWLEKTITYGWSVYMAVGIHTVQESAIAELGDRLQQMQLRTEDGTTRSVASGEQIIAVQYRKVQYNWYSGQKVDSAFLEVNCNQWEVYASIRMESTKEVVEASLKYALSKEDVEEEGEVYVVDGQVIVL